MMARKLSPGIELLDYQMWRMSFRAGQNSIIADNGHCEGYLEFEQNGRYRKCFFILNIDEMKFKYFPDNPKKNKNEMLGYVDIRYITKVSKITYKPKKIHSFVINTPSTKYTLAASSDAEAKNWVDALMLAAITPSKKGVRNSTLKKSGSLESITDAKSFQTHIVGGVVVKTLSILTPATNQNYLHHKLSAKRSNSSSTPSNQGSNPSGSTGIRTRYEGWCWKQGAVMKNWKRRYFRLNAIKLSYYDSNIEVKPIRSIVTHNIKGVRILPRFCSRNNCLEVETPNRKFYMHPEFEVDVQNWKSALEDVMLQTGMFIPRTKSI